ncbi:DNA repair protein REV1-like protein 2 [Stagonosporopsis vannaccii]|nr:DNA repair protein REV1-like protein 2 [Stagonosporopsis vannaccii]
MSAPGQDDRLNPTHYDDDHFAPPSSAQVRSLKRVIAVRLPASPTTAAPARRTFFDPWNSSSTGHQRAENRLSGSTSWRSSRSLKLGEQYKGGLNGGENRVTDTVGAGSEDFGKDGRKENGGWERGSRGLRTSGQRSLAETWNVSKAGLQPVLDRKASQKEPDLDELQGTCLSPPPPHPTTGLCDDSPQPLPKPKQKQIFQGLCFYVNGSTAPLVSDHKLKHLLSAYGGRHSIVLGRRTVTHVILGTTSLNGGCGGGLAATKLQKEVARIGGNAVKYITVEWVLESIKAGRRLPESRFAPLKLAQKSQGSVYAMLSHSKSAAHG